jgi:hypothetical protein
VGGGRGHAALHVNYRAPGCISEPCALWVLCVALRLLLGPDRRATGRPAGSARPRTRTRTASRARLCVKQVKFLSRRDFPAEEAASHHAMLQEQNAWRSSSLLRHPWKRRARGRYAAPRRRMHEHAGLLNKEAPLIGTCASCLLLFRNHLTARTASAAATARA